MSKPIPKRKQWTEGELLVGVMEGMDNEKAFRLGELMGIMRKGDAIYITRLERELEEMTTDRNEWRDIYHRLKRRNKEAEEVGDKG